MKATEARPFGCPHISQDCVGDRRSTSRVTPRPIERRQRSGSGAAMSFSLDERASRAGRNQSFFREINERVKDLNEGFSLVLPLGDWVCECAEEMCVARIELSADEYEGIRRNGTRFLVAPGDKHVWSDVEDVMERHDRYWVVEKLGEAARVSEQFDPRSPH